MNVNVQPISADTRFKDVDSMALAMDASNFLKAISHEGRLMILCHLASGEKSVTELEELLSARQAAVSRPSGGSVPAIVPAAARRSGHTQARGQGHLLQPLLQPGR